MPGMIFVALAMLDIQREWLRPQGIASNTDDLFGVGVIKQVECGMNSKRSTATQNCIRFPCHDLP